MTKASKQKSTFERVSLGVFGLLLGILSYIVLESSTVIPQPYGWREVTAILVLVVFGIIMLIVAIISVIAAVTNVRLIDV